MKIFDHEKHKICSIETYCVDNWVKRIEEVSKFLSHLGKIKKRCYIACSTVVVCH